jgi:hypothetical protein
MMQKSLHMIQHCSMGPPNGQTQGSADHQPEAPVQGTSTAFAFAFVDEGIHEEHQLSY